MSNHCKNENEKQKTKINKGMNGVERKREQQRQRKMRT